MRDATFNRCRSIPPPTPAQKMEAVFAAATDGLDKLRYPAGADSLMLAELRRSLPEQAFHCPRPDDDRREPSRAKSVS